ncbi:hypothetical protein CGRA01v4_05492 [Colletotrichum graminicola]|nr:hypothetical protein CGRA01v4_05492 [Colletotrichum graminicola]
MQRVADILDAPFEFQAVAVFSVASTPHIGFILRTPRTQYSDLAAFLPLVEMTPGGKSLVAEMDQPCVPKDVSL